VAAPAGQFKARPYFVVLIALVAVLYALVFLTPNHRPAPKLGLDLVGGTSITMSAQTLNGSKPNSQDLNVARDIISQRVNATGVTDAQVFVQNGRDIVVNVAGQDKAQQLKALLVPAKLEFRAVLNTGQALPKGTTLPPASATPTPTPSAAGSATPSNGAGVGASPSSSANPDAALAPRQQAPARQQAPSATPAGTPTPSPSAASPAPSASASASPTPKPTLSGQPTIVEVQQKVGLDAYRAAAALTAAPTAQSVIDTLKPFYNLTPDEVAVLPASMQFFVPTITCQQLNSRNPQYLTDDRFLGQQVVACDQTQPDVKYLLDAAKVQGTDVGSAAANYDPVNYASTGGWTVNLSFKGSGQQKWANLTKAEVGQQVAIVLDNEVVSAPQINQVITGSAVISGSGITQTTAHTLATQLKYGALPIGFVQQTAQTVSATLGLQQLQYGLLAGAIGLVLVVGYCLLYYRALGLVVIASLVVSAAIVFASLVLLGRSIGFTLSLAGIAGFIVAIGITADSFVVFFERLKDEVKDGRTVRSAVPRAWVRARRTILSADAVSFIAAVVLYALASDQVRGFAFTLGLSTIIDLIVVFLFTHPLVHVLSGSKTFTSPRFSGLGGLRGANTRGGPPAERVGSMRTKES
jgi:preprotein translocase subunit SecD